MLALLLLATGCASLSHESRREGSLGYTPRTATNRAERESPPRTADRPQLVAQVGEFSRSWRRRDFRTGAALEHSPSRTPVRGGAPIPPLPKGDAWGALLEGAGLDERDSRPVDESVLTPTHAARLLNVLMGKDVTLGQFPARVAVGFMLREVLDTGEVSRAELVRRAERFADVAVLRPDGYLAWVRTGRTQQKVEPVEWKDGAFRAYGFELGRFYDGRTGVFRLLDGELREANGFPIADVHDDADVVSRSLDGAEGAFVELALAIGKFFSTSPAENLEAFRQMPAAVVALIESSPEYLERFKYMTRGEQIQAVSKMVTNLIATWGTASSTARTLQGTALATLEAPVLSLSVNGMARMSLVAVPVGRAAAVLSGGPGAAIILQRASTAEKQGGPAKEPGEWGPSEEKGASVRARAYQEQISGRSYDDAYWVGGVGRKSGGTKFDGFKDDVLMEAKGPGYAEFFEKNLEPKSWYRDSGKAQDLIDQAQRQLNRTRGKGVPIEWHVAEKHAADAMRELFRNNDLGAIKVVHTPAR
ncbi:Tox-REase-5 domain-containing protein [Myxococcus landrumensis]|uniref:Tox-REase-5 domain-containing protein n=1 Tax=Myxococcus landrumensis TaxID=2813577 RepID=UPI001F50688D|nr:Tox-REase-5 domain-containing protein [Myxococcus landrumus]